VQNVNKMHTRIITAAECLPIPGKKLNIFLMCHATNGAHI